MRYEKEIKKILKFIHFSLQLYLLRNSHYYIRAIFSFIATRDPRKINYDEKYSERFFSNSLKLWRSCSVIFYISLQLRSNEWRLSEYRMTDYFNYVIMKTYGDQNTGLSTGRIISEKILFCPICVSENLKLKKIRSMESYLSNFQFLRYYHKFSTALLSSVTILKLTLAISQQPNKI